MYTCAFCLKVVGILYEMEFCNNFCVSLCSVLFHIMSPFHYIEKCFSSKRLFACSNEAYKRRNHHHCHRHPHGMCVCMHENNFQMVKYVYFEGFSLFNKRSKHLMNFAKAQAQTFACFCWSCTAMGSACDFLFAFSSFGFDFGQNNCQCKLCLEFFEEM